MKTTISILFFLIIYISSSAQFKSVTIGIDGLTCSACSFATEKSIKKLNFVDSVSMELDKNIATIYFKKNVPVSIDQLSKKVIDAGFSVRSMYAVFNFNDLIVTNDYCFVYENNVYQFIKIDAEKKLKGFISIQFIGENYMQKKEFKKWKMYCSSACKGAFNASVLSPSKNEYYITIR